MANAKRRSGITRKRDLRVSTLVDAPSAGAAREIAALRKGRDAKKAKVTPLRKGTFRVVWF